MTKQQKTQQVITLMRLIDKYAEACRVKGGWVHSAETAAARQLVLEAVRDIPAPTAAPALPTSVKGSMWFTKKPVTIQAIQWTGENLREVITFTDSPPDTRSHHAGMAWDDYRDLVARDGLKIYTLEGKMPASPGDWIIRGVKGELYPCKPDIFQETYAAASPAPPVEQAAPQPAPAPLSWQDERRAFEQDFMRALPGENLKRQFGHYEDPRTRHRWDGWKARASLAAQGGA